MRKFAFGLALTILFLVSGKGVAQTAKPQPTPTPEAPPIGFTEQKFEPSPLDELSKIEAEGAEKGDVGDSKTGTKCRLDNPASIQLRGFRLGMTIGEIHERLPEATPPLANLLGYTKKFIYLPRDKQLSNKPFLKGVVFIGLEFVDGKVSAILLSYDNDAGWASGKQFAQQIAETFSIRGQWEKLSSDNPFDDDWRIACGNQSFIAGLDWHDGKTMPAIGWFDNAASRIVAARASEEVERKRKEAETKQKMFKP